VAVEIDSGEIGSRIKRISDGWRVVDDDDYNQSVGNPKRKV
jgi:hypothetical protein